MMTLTPPAKNGRHHSVEDDLKIRRGSSVSILEMPEEARTCTFWVGLDWGTNKSCLFGCPAGMTEPVLNHVVPTMVGYAREGLLDDLLPANAKVLFGEDALKHRLHLRLVQPMVDGIIHDVEASRDFARHLRGLIRVEGNVEIRAVIGIPANAGEEARERVRQAMQGLFHRVILVPEPFLAALGWREEGDWWIRPTRIQYGIRCLWISARGRRIFALCRAISRRVRIRSAFRLQGTKWTRCCMKRSREPIRIFRFRRWRCAS